MKVKDGDPTHNIRAILRRALEGYDLEEAEWPDSVVFPIHITKKDAEAIWEWLTGANMHETIDE